LAESVVLAALGLAEGMPMSIALKPTESMAFFLTAPDLTLSLLN
jgi:hypothetical protein